MFVAEGMTRQEKNLMRRRMANAYMSSVVSISLVLMLIGFASLLTVNARRVADYFKENMQMTVLMKTEITEEKASAVQQRLQELRFVNTVRIVTREEGTEELKKMLGDDFLSVFETSPVPVSLEVTLKSDYVSADSVAMVTAGIMENPEVDEVDCQQSLVEALVSNMAKISVVLGVFIALLLFISFALIGNTVRLAVYSRRFTVYTMKMVGATRAFVRRPFLRESVWQGLASSVLAMAVLGAALVILRSSFVELFAILRTDTLVLVALIVVCSGVVICLVSTYLVVNKLLSLDKDDLYF